MCRLPGADSEAVWGELRGLDFGAVARRGDSVVGPEVARQPAGVPVRVVAAVGHRKLK